MDTNVVAVSDCVTLCMHRGQSHTRTSILSAYTCMLCNGMPTYICTLLYCCFCLQINSKFTICTLFLQQYLSFLPRIREVFYCANCKRTSFNVQTQFLHQVILCAILKRYCSTWHNCIFIL